MNPYVDVALDGMSLMSFTSVGVNTSWFKGNGKIDRK